MHRKDVVLYRFVTFAFDEKSITAETMFKIVEKIIVCSSKIYGFLTNIDETNSLYAYYAIRKLEKYVNEIDVKDNVQLLIFNGEELDLLVKNVVDSFFIKYSDLLVKYCKVV